MQLTLIDGAFSAAEAQELLVKMVQVKLRFHEEHIPEGSSEEDIAMRERRISRLQQELADIRSHLQSQGSSVQLHAVVEMEQPCKH